MLTQKGIEKDQFETTHEYSDRASGLLHSIASLSVERPLPGGYATYDADHREIVISILPLDLNVWNTPGQKMYFGLTLGERNQKLRSYTAQNGFGVKRVVFVEQTDRLGVIVPRNDEFWRYPGRKPIRIKMDRDDAKLALPRLMVRLRGVPGNPFKIEEWNIGQPTVDFPAQLNTFTRALVIKPSCAAIVDGRNGNVLSTFDPTIP